MSVLGINEEKFSLRAIDFMTNPETDCDINIWAITTDSKGFSQSEVNAWANKKTEFIRSQILGLNTIKPTGHQIRKILKEALGVNLSVHSNKYIFRQPESVYAVYDISSNYERLFADRVCVIKSDNLPCTINSIRITMYYPKMNVPAEGIKF